jgi:hypothetical protein
MQKAAVGRSGLEMWIPKAWSAFTYRGFYYVRVDSCTFAYMGPVKKAKAA